MPPRARLAALAAVLAAAAVHAAAAPRAAYAVARFKLVSADDDTVQLLDGDVLNASSSPFVRRHAVLADGDAFGGRPANFAIVAEIAPVGAVPPADADAVPAVTFTAPFVRTESFPPYALGGDVVGPSGTDYLPLRMAPGPVNVTAYVGDRADLATTITLNVLPDIPPPRSPQSPVGSDCALEHIIVRLTRSDRHFSAGIVDDDGVLLQCLGSVPRNAQYLVVAVAAENAGRRLVGFEGPAADCSGVEVPQMRGDESGQSVPAYDRLVCYNGVNDAERFEFNFLEFVSRETMRLNAAPPFPRGSRDSGFPAQPLAREPVCFKGCRPGDELFGPLCADGVPCNNVYSPFDSSDVQICGNADQRKLNGCLQPFKPLAKACERCSNIQDCVPGVECISINTDPGICGNVEQLVAAGCPELTARLDQDPSKEGIQFPF